MSSKAQHYSDVSSEKVKGYPNSKAYYHATVGECVGGRPTPAKGEGRAGEEGEDGRNDEGGQDGDEDAEEGWVEFEIEDEKGKEKGKGSGKS